MKTFKYTLTRIVDGNQREYFHAARKGLFGKQLTRNYCCPDFPTRKDAMNEIKDDAYSRRSDQITLMVDEEIEA